MKKLYWVLLPLALYGLVVCFTWESSEKHDLRAGWMRKTYSSRFCFITDLDRYTWQVKPEIIEIMDQKDVLIEQAFFGDAGSTKKLIKFYEYAFRHTEGRERSKFEQKYVMWNTIASSRSDLEARFDLAFHFTDFGRVYDEVGFELMKQVAEVEGPAQLTALDYVDRFEGHKP